MTSSPFLPVRWLIAEPDVSGDPEIFPLLPGQMFVSEKAPEWATTVKRSKSGREYRSGEWTAPRWNFKVAYEVLRERPGLTELSRLFEFFNMRRGKLGEFFYYDPTDHAVTTQFLGYGNGVQQAFQLVRRVLTWEEPVFAIYGTPVVFVNGVATTAFTIGDFGVITFTTAPPNGAAVTWSGDFMYWCRFDQDKLSAQQMVQRMWSSEGLSFVSLKP